MRTSTRSLPLVAALCWGVGAGAPVQGDEPNVSLYIPAFQADGPLGLRAATVLNLQIWQSLRRAPTPNPAGLSFGIGTVVGSPTPLPANNHSAAERAALAVGADAVLWGRAWRYGDGIVVQAYLTLPAEHTDEARVAWPATARVDGQPVSLSVKLPRRRYEFSPIVLERGVVESLESPAGLPMLAAKGSQQVVGHLGATFEARQQEGPWTRVRSGASEGWVHLPQLSAQRTEVVDFTGGVVRLLRTDWRGARDLLRRVVDNSKAPSALRVDALLLLGLAARHAGEDPLAPILQARELNPHDVEVTKYECMAYVSRLAEPGSARSQSEARQLLRDILKSRSNQFAPADPWFGKVRTIVGQ